MSDSQDPPLSQQRVTRRRAIKVVVAGVGALFLLALLRVGSVRSDLLGARADLTTAMHALLSHDDAATIVSIDRAARQLNASTSAARAFPLDLLRPVPILGGPSRAASAAARAGKEVVVAARLLEAASASFPTRGLGKGVDGHDLSGMNAAAHRSLAAIEAAMPHLDAARQALQRSSHATLPMVSASARSMLATLQRSVSQLGGARRGLRLLADLTAPTADVKLLVLSQDSLELRPTGGYIGSFGIVHFDHGGVRMERYEASETLPPPQPPMTPPGDLAPVLPGAWGLSNANWWPDFPTSAKTAEQLFARQGGGGIDGVLALTDNATARLVGAVGPLAVPGYAEPVTEETFQQRVLYEVELKQPPDRPKKKFLTTLAGVLFDRVFHMDGPTVPRVADAIARSIGSGDIQLWFADPARQREIDGSVVSGALPRVSGDFLLIDDANMSAGKANLSVAKDVSYRVTTGHGQLVAHLSVTVRDDGDPSTLNPFYSSFLRVYAPLGSVLLGNPQIQGDEGPAPDGPYEVFTQLVRVEPRGEAVVTFEYVLPTTIGANGDYTLTWLRQVGTARDSFSAELAGHNMPVVSTSRQAELHQSLKSTGLVAWVRRRWIFHRLGL